MREVEHGAVAIQGNHDAAIVSGTGGMNSIAAEAIEWTRPKLDATQREFLTQLPLAFENGKGCLSRQRACAGALGICH